MEIHIPGKLLIYVGRMDFGRRRGIQLCIGYRPEAPEYEIPWRHSWTWAPLLPRLIRSGFPGERRKIIGISAFGRTRIWR